MRLYLYIHPTPLCFFVFVVDSRFLWTRDLVRWRKDIHTLALACPVEASSYNSKAFPAISNETATSYEQALHRCWCYLPASLLSKLIVIHIVKKFTVFYVTQRLVYISYCWTVLKQQKQRTDNNCFVSRNPKSLRWDQIQTQSINYLLFNI
jgi:hypothetical protein